MIDISAKYVFVWLSVRKVTQKVADKFGRKFPELFMTNNMRLDFVAEPIQEFCLCAKNNKQKNR